MDTDGNLHALREREAQQEAYEARWHDCPECNGTGEVYVEVSGCDWNDPYGIFKEEPCKNCGGSGEVEVEDLLDDEPEVEVEDDGFVTVHPKMGG